MHRAAIAADLTLTWTDNSTNEEGFNVERRVGTTGTYAQLASVGVNVTSYTDTNLQTNTTYCYRVLAYNSTGSSAYSNEGCATTSPALPADITPPARSNGAPFGTLAAGTTQTTLNLTTNENASCRYATAAGIAYGSMSSTFATTGGTAHSTTVSGLSNGGSYSYFVRCQDTVGNANTNDFTINFSVASSQQTSGYQASVDFSSTQGFRNWYYLYGTGTQMTFVGDRWQGNETYLLLWADGGHPGNFSDAIRRWKAPQAGSINITGTAFDTNTACGSGASVYIKKNATILWQQAIANGDTIGVSFNVTTTAAAGDDIDFGINRGADDYWSCDWTGFDPRILLTSSLSPLLASTTAPSRTLAAGTTQTTLSLTTDVVNDLVNKVGVYRPSTGEWFLDQNGNGTWDGCEIDICVQTFSATGALPVVGDWDGSEFTKLGLFLPSTSQWQLDLNGDYTWDGCALDKCQESFGGSGDMPVAGQWTTAGSDRIGTFRTDDGTWYLDASGNGNLDCLWDYCFRFSNYSSGDVPVAGDWTGSGLTRVGLYRPSTGQWFLDGNGNRSWGGCSWDTCISEFGTAEDLPVTGDWSGTGASRIGVFRAATGEWMLDLNGNGQWDGCDVDLCLSGFGGAGDIPVVGKW